MLLPCFESNLRCNIGLRGNIGLVEAKDVLVSNFFSKIVSGHKPEEMCRAICDRSFGVFLPRVRVLCARTPEHGHKLTFDRERTAFALTPVISP